MARVRPDSPWRESGNTDLESFRRAISRSWNGQGNSPMAAEAEAVYQTLAKAGLARLGAAMAWHEIKNASWPDSPIPKRTHNAWAMKGQGPDGWADYPDYATAAADWSQRLLDQNGPYGDTVTLRDLINVYAPSFENDVNRYLDVICDEMNALPQADAGEQPAQRLPGAVELDHFTDR